MTASGPASRDERIATLAAGFVAWLREQTDIELDEPGAARESRGPAPLAALAAIERLDVALGQLADLASIYDASAGPSLEGLALPVAALTGEYLASAGAAWLPPDPDDPRPDETLTLVTADGLALDLLGVARAALLSGAPCLAAVAARLLDPVAEASG